MQTNSPASINLSPFGLCYYRFSVPKLLPTPALFWSLWSLLQTCACSSILFHWLALFSWRIWNCRSRSSTAQCALYLILFEKQKKKVSPGCHGFGSTATWPHLRDTKTEKANYPLTQRDELFGTLWNHAGVTWVIWFYTNLWSQCTLVVFTEGKVLKNAPLHIVKVNATHI